MKSVTYPEYTRNETLNIRFFSFEVKHADTIRTNYGLIRILTDLLRIFYPWANFEYAQNKSTDKKSVHGCSRFQYEPLLIDTDVPECLRITFISHSGAQSLNV